MTFAVQSVVGISMGHLNDPPACGQLYVGKEVAVPRNTESGARTHSVQEMGMTGLEPAGLAALDPKSSVSANSTTSPVVAVMRGRLSNP